VIEMPCQIVRSGGRLIYRLLSWTPWQGMFLRLVERLQGCWLCVSARSSQPPAPAGGPRGPVLARP
jgi:hypothetical protein